MQNQVFGAENEGALDFSAEGDDALLTHFIGLAAHVHQITGVDDQRTDVQGRTQLMHALGLLGVHFGGTPHTRAGRKNLKGVGANFLRLFNGLRDAASRADVHANSLNHGDSLEQLSCLSGGFKGVQISEKRPLSGCVFPLRLSENC